MAPFGEIGPNMEVDFPEVKTWHSMTKYEGFHFRFGVLPLSNRHSPHFELESESAATLVDEPVVCILRPT